MPSEHMPDPFINRWSAEQRKIGFLEHIHGFVLPARPVSEECMCILTLVACLLHKLVSLCSRLCWGEVAFLSQGITRNG